MKRTALQKERTDRRKEPVAHCLLRRLTLILVAAVINRSALDHAVNKVVAHTVADIVQVPRLPNHQIGQLAGFHGPDGIGQADGGSAVQSDGGENLLGRKPVAQAAQIHHQLQI